MSETEPGAAGRGLRALGGESFSLGAAVGGVRGLVETIAPGLLFVVVFVATGQRLVPSVVAAAAAALVAVIVRLVQRTPVTQALSGVVGVAVGVGWALTTGRAQDYYAAGLWTNAAYGLGALITILVGWPAVGVLVGLFDEGGPLTGGPWSAVGAFRSDPARRRRAVWATWLWVGLFGLKLAVQLPLYLAAQVAWLGVAKLVMGVPLFALTLWLSWVLVRPAPVPEQLRPHPGP
ncbi:MAG: DUF3159 domain-containing protein [Cellulomonas sp.]|nr:DUF3159 domain-containing protein [Cellulomonas sp.]